MTICFIGNNFKYEAEAIVKLFFFVEKFGYLFEEYPQDGDFCIIKRTVSENGYTLSVSVKIGDSTDSSETAKKGDFRDKEDEAELCTMLFFLLKSLTGIDPPWGSMTGIRPVKKVNELLQKGADKQAVFKNLKERYSVSEEKLELAYLTAVTQAEALKSLDKRSYSLYISIPFCPSRCSYCSFVSHSIESHGARKLLPEYTEKLCGELADISAIAKETGLRLDTVYIGGGTPTALSEEQLQAVMTAVQKNFDISKIREYTVEAGRSDTITEKKLEIIRDFGATRISVNPQTMNNGVLKAIGRRHTAEDFINAFNAARRIGFDNINTDVIAGLPTDTPESFERTIEALCGLDPESITIHTLTLKRSAALFRAENKELDGRTGEMVSFGQKTLLERGYLPYYLYRQKNTSENLENVGFAKAGRECLYNIYIMEETQTILAAGAGGSTKLVDNSTGRIERLFNYKYPYEYISRYDKMSERKNSIKEFFNNI